MTLSISASRPLSQRRKSVLASCGQGFRFIFGHATISFVMTAMTAGMFAVRCFGTLLSIYVRDILHSNAELYGRCSTH